MHGLTPDDRADEHALLERARRGEGDAYGELVIRFQGLAARTAYLITRDRSEAEEAVQDAFVKAYQALGRFRVGEPFRPWLMRIVANEAINRRKSAGRRPTVELTEVFDRPLDDDAGSPEAAALGAETRRTVLEALARLREEDRLIISYRYFLDLSEAEMSETLGVARGTVKSRLSRAMARLREVLRD